MFPIQYHSVAYISEIWYAVKERKLVSTKFILQNAIDISSDKLFPHKIWPSSIFVILKNLRICKLWHSIFKQNTCKYFQQLIISQPYETFQKNIRKWAPIHLILTFICMKWFPYNFLSFKRCGDLQVSWSIRKHNVFHLRMKRNLLKPNSLLWLKKSCLLH